MLVSIAFFFATFPSFVAAGDFRLADALMKSCLQTFSEVLIETLEKVTDESTLIDVRGAASQDVALCAGLAIDVCSVGILESQDQCFSKLEMSIDEIRQKTITNLPETISGTFRSRSYRFAFARAKEPAIRLDPSPTVPPQLTSVLSEAMRLADARTAQRLQIYAQREVQE
ncbi:hypothetical protein [Ruegeria faecimaris]|nr:hypothetical protein [Ruegeria faecimaris]